MASHLERLRHAFGPKYTLEREIDSGGMGLVFLGRNTRLRSCVAIKVLQPELANGRHGSPLPPSARSTSVILQNANPGKHAVEVV